MHNLFRCACGARVVCGTGDPEYDKSWNGMRSDHLKMGHTILKPLKIPSNTIEARKMNVHDPEVETKDADDGHTYYQNELVA